jgi:hypothetical protein
MNCAMPDSDASFPRTAQELMNTKYFRDFLGWLPKTLGVSEEFVARIERDDDWTFIIKIHALIEAGLNHAITKVVNKPELADIISQLDTGDRRYGKLAFAEALEILSKQERGFIRILSKLRNDLVHKIKNVDFVFSTWLQPMQSAARKSLIETISAGVTESVTHEGKTMSNVQFCDRYPRQAILANAMGIILHVHLWHERAEVTRLKEQLASLHLKMAEAEESSKPQESNPTE